MARKNTSYSQKQFIDAIESENEKLIKKILKDDNFDPSKQASKIIRATIETENLAVFNLLLKDERIDFTTGKYLAIKLAVEHNQSDMLTELLQLEGVSENINTTMLYNLLKKSVEAGHNDVATAIIDTKLISYEKTLLWAVQHNHVFIVQKLLTANPEPDVLSDRFIKAAVKHKAHADLFNALIASNRFGVQKLLPWAVEGNHYELTDALLTHPDTDPSYEENRAIRDCAKQGYTEIIELLLDHPKTNPADCNNHALKRASYYGRTKIVELLLALKDKGIDPNVDNNYCLKRAASQQHTDIVRLLMPHCVSHRVKLTDIIPIDSPTLSDDVNDFITSPESYINDHPRLTLAQKKAFEILELKTNIHHWEEEQRKADAEDLESAMRDEKVTRSKLTFEKIVKPAFEEKFLAHAASDFDVLLEKDISEADKLKAKNLSALIKIEQNIRELILDKILAANPLQATLDFIKLNKKELIKATDKALMKTARNDHFNSRTDRFHLAWRGYDARAPYKGFFNLLTPPKKEEALFTTAAANTEENAELLNTTASMYVRKMVAHYFLLVNDKNDGIEASQEIKTEILEARRDNFISELADMRSAHSEDYKNKHDGPSCYPGYLGRIANMGYEHPLTKQTVSTKMFIEGIMEPHIFTQFKESLEKCQTEQEGLTLLETMTLLTETGWRAQNIFLGLENYDEKLITLRKDFIDTIGTQDNNIILVNKELEKSGRLALTNKNDFNEQSYVFQYLLDPARGKLSGKFAHEYQKWVKKFYIAQDNAEPKEDNQENLKTEPTQNAITLNNPYSSNANQIREMLKKNKTNTMMVNMLAKRLQNIVIKESMFDLIQSQLITLPVFNLDKYDLKTYALFAEVLTEVLFEAEQKNLDLLGIYLQSYVWKNLSQDLNQEIETKLNDHSDKDEFAGVLDILTEMAAPQQKHVIELVHNIMYTPLRSTPTPPRSPSKANALPKSPLKTGVGGSRLTNAGVSLDF